MEEASKAVLVWWGALSAISVVNLVVWWYVARRRGGAGWRWQAGLSAIFVLVCAYRSVLPRAEGQRICLYDSWVSSAVLARTGATVAELAFVAQLALLLRACAKGAGSRIGVIVSWAMLPAIAVAETFSWYTTLTTNFLGSVIEESIWATTLGAMTVSLMLLLWRYEGRVRRFLMVAVVIGVCYVSFMCTVDVPMYLGRWRAAQAIGKSYLSVGDGWSDALSRRVVTRRWEDWRQEMPWMSLYFSVAVWLSIGLMRTPELVAAPARRRVL